MTHPLLFNPFHAKPEQAPKPERRAALSTRSTPVCSKCGSDDILSRATAQWSNEKQEWELANTFAQPAQCEATAEQGNRMARVMMARAKRSNRRLGHPLLGHGRQSPCE